MLGLGTLVAALLLSRDSYAGSANIQSQSKSILRTFIPELTGENGLEDYFKAFDLMNDDVSSVYVEGASYPEYDSSEIKAKKARLSEQLNSLDYLELQRAFVSRYPQVYDLVVQGNRKPCVLPAAGDVSPKGLVSATRVAYLIRARAYCLNAVGKQAEGLETLLNGITFSLRSGSVNTMAYLCNIRGERSLFDGLLEQLPRMSLADSNRVEAYVNDAIKEPPLTAGLLQRSSQVHEIMFQKYDVADAIMKGHNDYPEYRTLLAQASQSELSEFTKQVRGVVADGYRAQYSALEVPESQWYDASTTWKSDFSDVRVSKGMSVSDLAKAFGRSLVPAGRNLVITELRRRAQLRLLGLHALVVGYRWHQHRLPRRLSDFAKGQAAFDPLSGESFVFEPHEDGTYRLYSRGRPETGIVELHYNAPVGSVELKP